MNSEQSSTTIKARILYKNAKNYNILVTFIIWGGKKIINLLCNFFFLGMLNVLIKKRKGFVIISVFIFDN